MDRNKRMTTPIARTERLLVEALEAETLVYDLQSHTAHCLNAAAAHVWKMADGTRTVSDIATTLPGIGLPADESIVASALDELTAAALVTVPDPPHAWGGISRRQALRALGMAAGASLLFPAVDSVAAPLAAAAASCVTLGQCTFFIPPACGGLPICGSSTKCCLEKGNPRKPTCDAVNC